MRARVACLVASLGAAHLATGCVPEGPSTGAAGASTATKHGGRTALKPATTTSHALIAAPFFDDFNRAELGDNWTSLSPHWRLDDGRLCGRGVRNRGVWLKRRLPINARIEFDAYAESADGDVKAELWGDGVSGATGASYSNATSYLTIFGGWKNTKHVLARLDEHGIDRLEIDVDANSDDERERAVSVGQPYHFKIERADGRSVSWAINGVTYLELTDEEPLLGPGHDHVGFNDWDAPVCFDNLRVTPL